MEKNIAHCIHATPVQSTGIKFIIDVISTNITKNRFFFHKYHFDFEKKTIFCNSCFHVLFFSPRIYNLILRNLVFLVMEKHYA